MADQMAMKMSAAGSKGASKANPKRGDRYRCSQCGMEIQITSECTCKDPDHVHFQCCNQAMAKA